MTHEKCGAILFTEGDIWGSPFNIHSHIFSTDRVFAIGGDDPQMWRVAFNILNELSRAADKEWSYDLRVGRGVKSPHSTKSTCYEVPHSA
jgi:hypothetical protein